MRTALKHIGIVLSGCVLAVCMLIFAVFVFYMLNEAFGDRAYFLDMYTISAIAAFLYTLSAWIIKKPICRKLKLGGIPYLISAVPIPAVIFAIISAAIRFANTRISLSDDSFEVYLLSLFVCYELAFSTAATILIELFLFLKSKLEKV